jgi:hypothetical protein
VALSVDTIWEARSATGANTNGGGFVAGATGTDRSQQDAAFASGTNLTVDATTNTDVAPDGHTPATTDVGNLIQITAGAGFTTGFYEIKSIQAGKWRLDRSPAATGTAGGTWALGGALGAGAFGILDGVMLNLNKAYFKGTGFVETATTTWAQNVNPTDMFPHTRLIGYGTTRGDAVHALLTLQTNTGLTAINGTGGGLSVEQIDVNCASLGTSTGIVLPTASQAIRCKVSNFTTRGINISGADNLVLECEITGGTSAATAALQSGQINAVTDNYIHDNVCPGMILTQRVQAIGNLVANNTGANSDGIRYSYGSVIEHNTCHGNGLNGLVALANSPYGQVVRNNLLTSNGGYGIKANPAGAMGARFTHDGNAFWNNSSGPRNNMDSTTGIFGVNPYTNVRDVTLTGSPYVDAAGGNYGLNTTAGAGAAARAAGSPGAWPGLAATIGYPDMGAVQHQDSGGSSGPVGHGRLTGGLQ